MVTAARDISADTVNQLLYLGRGIIFVAIPPERTQELLLAPMLRPALSSNNQTSTRDYSHLKICLSVEAREGITTGISASDRATTIRALGADIPNPKSLISPGHIFPVEVCTGGVLVKCALPEAALDLTQSSTSSQAAAYIDLLDSEGEFLTIEKTFDLASSLALPIIGLSQLISYRLSTTTLIARIAETRLPTIDGGLLKSIAYSCKIDNSEHIALIKGEINSNQAVLTRIQVEAPLSDVFGGGSHTSRNSIKRSLAIIQERHSGVLVYLRGSTLRKSAFQKHQSQTDNNSYTLMRNYGIGAQILRDLNISKVELLYNHPRIHAGLETFGIEIVKHQQLSST